MMSIAVFNSIVILLLCGKLCHGHSNLQLYLAISQPGMGRIALQCNAMYNKYFDKTMHWITIKFTCIFKNDKFSHNYICKLIKWHITVVFFLSSKKK